MRLLDEQLTKLEKKVEENPKDADALVSLGSGKTSI